MARLIAVVTEQGITEQMRKLQELEGVGGIGTTRLKAGMKAAAAITQNKAAADMTAVAEENLSAMMGGIGGSIKPLAPANPATPKRVMTHEVYVNGPMDVVGVVKSKVRRYMTTAQVGRGPGKHPPMRAMRRWVADVMDITDKKQNQAAAKELSHAIATQGIQGTPTLEKSLGEVSARVEGIFLAELERIVKALEVNNGR